LDKVLIKYSEKYIKPIFKPLEAIFKKLIAPWLGKLKKLKDLPKAMTKAIQAQLKGILEPKELNVTNYYRIGRYFVAKRLLLFLLLLVCFLIYILFVKPPAYVNKWFNRFTVIHEKVGKTYNNTGKIKIISPEKTLKYEGDLVDGLYEGNGKLYEKGKFYKGEFKSGSKNGVGELYTDTNPMKLIYKGLFENDVYSGQGASYGDNKNVLFEGEFKNGKLEGAGRAYYPSDPLQSSDPLPSNGPLEYEGLFSNGVYNGAGKLWSKAGVLLYDGNFQNGQYSGEGTDFYANQFARYKGLFLDGKYSGAGQLLNEDGTLQYEGNFKNGLFSGAGVEHYSTGLIRYKGEYLVGKYSGAGELLNEKGVALYKGSFFDGQFNGVGEKSNEDAVVLYNGQFKEGLYDGIGTLFALDGTALYKGFFTKDNLYPQGFLGISRIKLEEIEGKPTDINVNEDPMAPESLLSNYNDLSMSFVLKVSAANPKESSVSTVIISNTNLMSMIRSELSQGYVKGNLEDVGLRQTVSEDSYSITFKIDQALFAFFYAKSTNSLIRLEIS
jgi:hypothetical protein